MQYTGNYKLKKPDGTDLVKISDLNENADIIDQKIKELDDHTINKSNPHGITPAQIGAETPAGAQAKANSVQGKLDTHASAGLDPTSTDALKNKHLSNAQAKKWEDHTANKNNPHNITVAQIGAETPSGAQAKVNTHANRKDNPHGVTRAQLGLADVLATDSNSDFILYVDDVGDKLMPTKPATNHNDGSTSVEINLPPGTKQIQFIWSGNLSANHDGASVSLSLNGAHVASTSLQASQPGGESQHFMNEETPIVPANPGVNIVTVSASAGSNASASVQCDGVKLIGLGIKLID